MSINHSFGLPLKMNFAEFVYYNGVFLPHEIDKIISLWDDDKTIKATLGGDEKEYDDELRQSSVMFLDDSQEMQWIYEKLKMIAISANQERYWFDLLGFHQELQLTRYSEGDFFD
ncbi:hypothetical protein N9Y60_00660 [Crocinitomicaceae bacterium]|nr:hypothetical protein [Crocinitomicaceae bacterium]